MPRIRTRSLPRVLAVLAAISLAAEELPKGRVIERVECRGDATQTYALYLPSAYSPDRAWPILYCLDPGARGRMPVQCFQTAAEHAGVILAGSNNSRNGSLDIARDAIRWLLADTQERFALDNARTYIAGFSGGARLALAWAANSRIAGVIACGAGFGSAMPKEIPFRLFAAAGVDDFNYDEVYALSRDLSRRGSPVRFAQFDGGHDWLPESLTAEALDFLAARLDPAPPPPETAQQKKAALRYSQLQDELEHDDDIARRSTIRQLQRDSELANDSTDRRVARRVLMGAFIGAMEQGRSLLAAKKYGEAARAWEMAVLLRPKNPEAWYSLAQSRAGARDKRRALDALEHAVSAGFDNRDRLDHDPLFDSLRTDNRYTALFR